MRNFFSGLFSNPTIIFASYDGKIMTAEWSDGDVIQYEGDCTVWKELPYMYHCNTFTCKELNRVWSYIKLWNGYYPNAHKTKESLCNSCCSRYAINVSNKWFCEDCGKEIIHNNK